MSVIHIEKRDRWASISNTVLEDKRLSYKARGLLAYLLTKPDDWQANVPQLAAASAPDGETSIRTALDELVQHGYASYEKPRSERGRFVQGGWTIRENPRVENPHVENPAVENPHVVSPDVENHHHSNDLEERKNLEEVKTETPSVSPIGETAPPPIAATPVKQGVQAKATRRCPAAYHPSLTVRQWAQEKFPEIVFEDALDAMRDWEFKTAHSDWDATLRTWIRTEAKRGPGSRSSPRSGVPQDTRISDKGMYTIQASKNLIARRKARERHDAELRSLPERAE